MPSLYLNSNEHLRQGNEVETREERKNKELREQFPLHGVKRSAPILHRIRSRKTGGSGADQARHRDHRQGLRARV
jgi:hypothetical protein